MRLVSKVARESLLVRWAGKKRDRVDEILVRELQVALYSSLLSIIHDILLRRKRACGLTTPWMRWW